MPTRRTPNKRTPEWCLESDIYWESWSLNGEVCIKGLNPPFKDCKRLAHTLIWLVRSFVSRCRRVHDVTGAFDPLFTSPRMPSTLDMNLSLSFDLALRDPRLISERVRRRGGEPSACAWPEFWLEGRVHHYILNHEPIPPGETRKPKIIILAETRQAVVSAQKKSLPTRLLGAWTRSLDVLTGVDEVAVSELLDGDEQGFLANILVLVHERPATRSKQRLPLEESYRRHESLITELNTSAQTEDLPVVWHALWRLPPAMTCGGSGEQPWMRYPAVSFAVAGRSLPVPRGARSKTAEFSAQSAE